MTTILALDTATNACSAAVWTDGAVRSRRFETMVRGHAERLVPMLAEVTAEAGLNPKHADLIAVTVGPGAFTGLRVGLAAARGLALAAGTPCLGLTTMEAIAAAVADRGDGLVVALDSKRADLYVQMFGPTGAALSDAVALAPEVLADFVGGDVSAGAALTVAGDAAETAAGLLTAAGFTVRDAEVLYPDASVIAELAAGRWTPGQEVARPAPLYLRPPDAVVPKAGGRLRP